MAVGLHSELRIITLKRQLCQEEHHRKVLSQARAQVSQLKEDKQRLRRALVEAELQLQRASTSSSKASQVAFNSDQPGVAHLI